jgi:hypothetical protein
VENMIINNNLSKLQNNTKNSFGMRINVAASEQEFGELCLKLQQRGDISKVRFAKFQEIKGFTPPENIKKELPDRLNISNVTILTTTPHERTSVEKGIERIARYPQGSGQIKKFFEAGQQEGKSLFVSAQEAFSMLISSFVKSNNNKK